MKNAIYQNITPNDILKSPGSANQSWKENAQGENFLSLLAMQQMEQQEAKQVSVPEVKEDSSYIPQQASRPNNTKGNPMENPGREVNRAGDWSKQESPYPLPDVRGYAVQAFGESISKGVTKASAPNPEDQNLQAGMKTLSFQEKPEHRELAGLAPSLNNADTQASYPDDSDNEPQAKVGLHHKPTRTVLKQQAGEQLVNIAVADPRNADLPYEEPSEQTSTESYIETNQAPGRIVEHPEGISGIKAESSHIMGNTVANTEFPDSDEPEILKQNLGDIETPAPTYVRDAVPLPPPSQEASAVPETKAHVTPNILPINSSDTGVELASDNEHTNTPSSYNNNAPLSAIHIENTGRDDVAQPRRQSEAEPMAVPSSSAVIQTVSTNSHSHNNAPLSAIHIENTGQNGVPLDNVPQPGQQSAAESMTMPSSSDVIQRISTDNHSHPATIQHTEVESASDNEHNNIPSSYDNNAPLSVVHVENTGRDDVPLDNVPQPGRQSEAEPTAMPSSSAVIQRVSTGDQDHPATIEPMSKWSIPREAHVEVVHQTTPIDVPSDSVTTDYHLDNAQIEKSTPDIVLQAENAKNQQAFAEIPSKEIMGISDPHTSIDQTHQTGTDNTVYMETSVDHREIGDVIDKPTVLDTNSHISPVVVLPDSETVPNKAIVTENMAQMPEVSSSKGEPESDAEPMVSRMNHVIRTDDTPTRSAGVADSGVRNAIEETPIENEPSEKLPLPEVSSGSEMRQIDYLSKEQQNIQLSQGDDVPEHQNLRDAGEQYTVRPDNSLPGLDTEASQPSQARVVSEYIPLTQNQTENSASVLKEQRELLTIRNAPQRQESPQIHQNSGVPSSSQAKDNEIPSRAKSDTVMPPSLEMRTPENMNYGHPQQSGMDEIQGELQPNQASGESLSKGDTKVSIPPSILSDARPQIIPDQVVPSNKVSNVSRIHPQMPDRYVSENPTEPQNISPAIEEIHLEPESSSILPETQSQAMADQSEYTRYSSAMIRPHPQVIDTSKQLSELQNISKAIESIQTKHEENETPLQVATTEYPHQDTFVIGTNSHMQTWDIPDDSSETPNNTKISQVPIVSGDDKPTFLPETTQASTESLGKGDGLTLQTVTDQIELQTHESIASGIRLHTPVANALDNSLEPQSISIVTETPSISEDEGSSGLTEIGQSGMSDRLEPLGQEGDAPEIRPQMPIKNSVYKPNNAMEHRDTGMIDEVPGNMSVKIDDEEVVQAIRESLSKGDVETPDPLLGKVEKLLPDREPDALAPVREMMRNDSSILGRETLINRDTEQVESAPIQNSTVSEARGQIISDDIQTIIQQDISGTHNSSFWGKLEQGEYGDFRPSSLLHSPYQSAEQRSSIAGSINSHQDVPVNSTTGMLFRNEDTNAENGGEWEGQTLTDIQENEEDVAIQAFRDSLSEEFEAALFTPNSESVTPDSGNQIQKASAEGEFQVTSSLSELPDKIPQYANKMVSSEGASSISIQLEPEHLGKIRFRVSLRNKRISASLSVDRVQTKEIIELQLPDIRKNLANYEIEVTELSVSLENDLSGSNPRYSDSFRDGQGNDMTAPYQRGKQDDDIDEQMQEILPQRYIRTNALVDLLV